MVTIIPKPPKRTPQWQIILFYFSLALLLTAVVAYFILNYYQDRYLATLNDLEEEFVQLSTVENKKIETKVLTTQRRIKDFSLLLSEHQKSSQIFEYLEGVTHPKVWFTNLELGLSPTQVRLTGLTQNFQTLDQQIYILREQDLIEETKLMDISLGEEGGARFSLELSLSPEIFK